MASRLSGHSLTVPSLRTLIPLESAGIVCDSWKTRLVLGYIPPATFSLSLASSVAGCCPRFAIQIVSGQPLAPFATTRPAPFQALNVKTLRLGSISSAGTPQASKCMITSASFLPNPLALIRSSFCSLVSVVVMASAPLVVVLATRQPGRIRMKRGTGREPEPRRVSSAHS